MGIYNLSVDEVIKEAKEAENLGIKSVILFGIPGKSAVVVPMLTISNRDLSPLNCLKNDFAALGEQNVTVSILLSSHITPTVYDLNNAMQIIYSIPLKNARILSPGGAKCNCIYFIINNKAV